mgnify:CR=1 FL=1
MWSVFTFHIKIHATSHLHRNPHVFDYVNSSFVFRAARNCDCCLSSAYLLASSRVCS